MVLCGDNSCSRLEGGKWEEVAQLTEKRLRRGNFLEGERGRGGQRRGKRIRRGKGQFFWKGKSGKVKRGKGKGGTKERGKVWKG